MDLKNLGIRSKLSIWAEKTFGQIHIGDRFRLNEEVTRDKKENPCRRIILGLKKYQGYKRSWTNEDTFERWKIQIKDILGDEVLDIDIRSTEGNELSHVARRQKLDEKMKESQKRIWAYQFTIIINMKEMRGD